MKTLLKLQEIDLDIERLNDLEQEIPKQKNKFKIHLERLESELRESEERCVRLTLEQRECEGDIEQKQAEIGRKDGQLLAVRKNEEYQALLHEMEMLKKQIGVKEERIIELMLEGDEAKAHFVEDQKRIAKEKVEIEAECNKIDQELAEAVAGRKQKEVEREPLLKEADVALLSRYRRIRKAKKRGPALVPLRNESCSGCYMAITAQVVNEVLAGDKHHVCSHCGRLLYAADNAMYAADSGKNG